MPLVPRPLVALRRRPLLYWAAAAGLACLTALVVARTVSAADAALARYGDTRTVAVTRRAVSAGHLLTPADVDLRPLPRALVPDGAVTEIPDGRRTRVALASGEVVLASRLAPGSTGEVAARLPEGSVALAIPLDGPALRLEVGDRVDVLATVDPAAAGDEPPTFLVVEGAPVVDVAETAVAVAVPRRDASRLAFALVAGVITLALTSG